MTDYSDFVSRHPVCLDPVGCAGECHVISKAFVNENPGAILVNVDAYQGEVRTRNWSSVHPMRWIHTMAYMDGLYIDFTARQYDADHPVPRVMTREEVLRDWCFITPIA